MDTAEFQTFLDAISDCFINRDFAPWEARILLPFTMTTRLGPVLLRDTKALRTNFDHYVKACEIMHLDTIYRRPISLEDARNGTMIGTYETELLSHGQRATPPYVASMLLNDTAEGWKMSSILNARGHADWTGLDPMTETDK